MLRDAREAQLARSADLSRQVRDSSLAAVGSTAQKAVVDKQSGLDEPRVQMIVAEAVGEHFGSGTLGNRCQRPGQCCRLARGSSSRPSSRNASLRQGSCC